MAQGRARDEWSRMSALMALTANCHRDPDKQEAFEPDYYNPFAEQTPKAPPPTVGIGILKAFVPDKGSPELRN